MKLRDYQQKDADTLYQRLQNGARLIYRLGTGGGKTAVAADIISRYVEDDKTALVLVHKDFLVKQFLDGLHELDLALRIGVTRGKTAGADDAPIQIATIQTLHNRQNALKQHFDLIVMDECHHAGARTWREVVARYPGAPILGLTASPARMDGKGLGETFHDIFEGPDNQALVDAGYRAPVRVLTRDTSISIDNVGTFAGDYQIKDLACQVTDRVVKEAVDAYFECREQTIFFGEDINHSKMVAEALQNHAVRAVHVDGKTKTADRERIFAEYEAGRIDVLCNADIMMEGLDLPSCRVVIIHRHTKSLVRYLQMTGRGSRPAPGKTMTLIDLCGNYDLHGHPDDERLWMLEMDQPINVTRRPAQGSADLAPANLTEVGWKLSRSEEKLVQAGLSFGWYASQAEAWAKEVIADIPRLDKLYGGKP